MDDVISSKNLCFLIIGILRLIDRRIVDHGCRVAYMMQCLLELTGKYKRYQIAEYAFIAALHDIGAYKVERGVDMLKFEMQTPMPHSIYGYLFLKNLSPFGERSKILMYSHVDYQKLKGIDFKDKDIANMLNFAGKVDLFKRAKGDKYDYNKLRQYIGKIYSQQCFDLLDVAAKRYDIFEKFKTGAHMTELESLFGDLMFSDEEKEKMLEILVYLAGFDTANAAMKSLTCACVAEKIADEMDDMGKYEKTRLYYASLLHNIGMAAVPPELREEDKLTDEKDIAIYRRHLALAENLLDGKIGDDIIKVIMRHHERIDGSGYPEGLEGPEMEKMEKILQVSDRIAEIAYRGEDTKQRPSESIATIITNEMNRNWFHRPIVKIFTENHAEIMAYAEKRIDEIMANFNKLNMQYEQVKKAMGV
ncbi:MAG: HD domain-containing protein [Lachnospiraceae bacterium]|nr:HD domain-containing protein [Lachnospiraceae bacterium]